MRKILENGKLWMWVGIFGLLATLVFSIFK